MKRFLVLIIVITLVGCASTPLHPPPVDMIINQQDISQAQFMCYTTHGGLGGVRKLPNGYIVVRCMDGFTYNYDPAYRSTLDFK